MRNKLRLARPAETISLPLAQLPVAVRQLAPASLRVRDADTKMLLVSQLLDTNGDGTPDELLFQTTMPARGTKTFTLVASTEAPPASPLTTFARFVPERLDDFAWETHLRPQCRAALQPEKPRWHSQQRHGLLAQARALPHYQ